MWSYNQTTGVLSRGSQILGIGYSGNGKGINNPDLQNIEKVGPIPVGHYRILPPIDTAKHGPFFLPLLPAPQNEMFGRSNFGIHGERLEPPPGLASEGCIIISPKAKREELWNSGDYELEVVKGA